jgi:hypothetical protein
MKQGWRHGQMEPLFMAWITHELQPYGTEMIDINLCCSNRDAELMAVKL